MSRVQRLVDADVVQCHLIVRSNLMRGTVDEAQKALRKYAENCEAQRLLCHTQMRAAAEEYGEALHVANDQFLKPNCTLTPAVFESHCNALRETFRRAQSRAAAEYVSYVRRYAAMTLNASFHHPLPIGD